MKKLLITLFALSTLLAKAQFPQGINYQSIIRNTSGVVLPSTPVTVEFRLYSSPTFTLPNVLLYDETHSTTTNSFGMVNLVIGQGTVVGGLVSFNNIPWIVAGVHYEVWVNSSQVGTRQPFMSVPYALNALTAAWAPSPTLAVTGNTLTVGSNTVAIPTGPSYIAGTGIGISGNTISNSAPDQTVTVTGLGSATVTGTYPNFSIETPTVSAATPPTIVGAGSATVTSAGNTFTVNTPSYVPPTITGTGSATVTSAGNSFTVDVPAASVPSITGAGATTVTSSGNTFTVNSPAPFFYTAGSDISITSGTVINNTAPDKTVTINAAGAATVTGAYPNFTLNVPNGTALPNGYSGQLLFNNGTIWDTIPRTNLYFDGTNFGIGTLSPQMNFHVVGAGRFDASVTTPQIFTDNIKITGGTNGQVLTSDNTGNGTWQTPPTYSLTQGGSNINLTQNGTAIATVTLTAATSTSLSAGSSNIVLTQAGNAYTITPVTPTFVNAGPTTITGTYPNYTVNSTATPSTTLVQGNNVGLNQSGNTYTVSSVTPTLTVNGGALTGSYPTQTLTIPTSSTTLVNAGTNISVTGAAPNYTISSPSQSLAINSNSLSITGGNTVTIPTSNVVPGNANITVVPSGNTYSVSAVTPTLTVNGGALTGSYPTQTLTIPTNSTTLVNAGTNIAVTGAAPNYTISSPSQSLAINSNSLSITGANTVVIPTSTVVAGSNISVTPSGNSYTVSATAYSLTSNTNTLTLSNGSSVTTATVPMFSLAGGAANSLTKWTSATTLGNSLITDDGSNIGINNGSPTARLDVLGTFKLADGSQGTGKFLMSDGVGNASWNFPPAGPWTRNATTVSLTNPGDFVGIGTATPNAPLQVANYISFENAGSNTSLGFNTGGGVTPNNYYNTFVGAGAGQAVGTGTSSSNSFLGYHAGQNTVNGNNNTFMGSMAGAGNNVGSGNSFFGAGAGQANSTGINNVFIGAAAGTNNTTAQNNTFLGNGADLSSSTQYTNASAIGYNTKVADNDLIALGNNSDVVIGGNKAGTIAGATRYLSVINNGPYTSTSNTSLELRGNINSASASAARIDFINGLTPTSIARIEAITGTGSTIQGALRFFINGGSLTEAMRITQAGNVGIGTTTPGGQFELSLDQGRKPGTTAWTVVSDERLKNIEGAYTKGLNEILQLNPVKYHYKNAGERTFRDEVLKKQQVGFSAQEVQRIFPEAVGVDDDGYLNLNIHAILIAYTNAVKELNAKAESQQKTIEEQKKAIEALQLKYDERLRKLEAAFENKTQK